MRVNFDLFLDWAERHFDSVKVSGNEVKLNSIYDPDGDDRKHKLWCNPSGETKKGDRENGVYHCWISGKKGTLPGLVMDVEHCSYDEACEKIGCDDGMSRIEEQLEAFFGDKKVDKPAEAPDKKILPLPTGTTPIASMSPWSKLRRGAEEYLSGRRIPVGNLAVCDQGDYRDRIVIPYRDRDGDLVYYNCRYIGASRRAPKYLGPPKEVGVGKGDVVFMPTWVEPGCILHVTEGEFDAMVLSMCGLPSCSVGGSHLSDYQRRLLKGYTIKLCGDIDKPGAGAIFRTGTQMLGDGFRGVTFVRPPKGYKDWNDMYIKFGDQVSRWIEEKSKPFDLITAEQLFAENV